DACVFPLWLSVGRSKLAPFVGWVRERSMSGQRHTIATKGLRMDGWTRPAAALRPRRDQRGVAAVEFGLVALFFFTVLFAIIDWSYLFFANLSMQHAVREGARYAVVGRSDLAPEDRPGDRCAAVREKIRQQSWG